MNTLARIAIWLGSMLASVAVFSVLFSLVLSGGGALLLILRITLLFALPVWCLSVPMVVMLKKGDGEQSRLILLVGSLIGPVAIVLWSWLLQVRGGSPQQIWAGDPLIGIGGIWGAVFALIVGFLTACFYLAFLRILKSSLKTVASGPRVKV